MLAMVEIAAGGCRAFDDRVGEQHPLFCNGILEVRQPEEQKQKYVRARSLKARRSVRSLLTEPQSGS